MNYGEPVMNRIESKSNRIIKEMRSLEKKKYRDIENLYVAEGLRTVRDMLYCPSMRYIVVMEAMLEKEDYRQIVEDALANDKKVFLLDASLGDPFQFTEHSQGIWAVLEKEVYSLDRLMASWKEEANEAYILLDSVQDPGNVGTIIRTALAAGVKAIFLTKGSVDIYNLKTVRSTMSALTKLPIYTGLEDEDVRRLMGHETVQSFALVPNGETYYTDIAYSGRNLFILGNEGNGIRQEWINLADKGITIPMYGDIESLNLSVAASLMMYKAAEFLQV